MSLSNSQLKKMFEKHILTYTKTQINFFINEILPILPLKPENFKIYINYIDYYMFHFTVTKQ